MFITCISLVRWKAGGTIPLIPYGLLKSTTPCLPLWSLLSARQPEMGFVREELLAVRPNTTLPPLSDTAIQQHPLLWSARLAPACFGCRSALCPSPSGTPRLLLGSPSPPMPLCSGPRSARSATEKCWFCSPRHTPALKGLVYNCSICPIRASTLWTLMFTSKKTNHFLHCSWCLSSLAALAGFS